MKTVIIIPSRMSSLRFPGKPMVKINGTPMIQRVWQKALASNIGEVYVACAEKEVFNLISGLGGNSILTDPNLPTGTDRIQVAFNEIKDSKSYECIINLQGDMPFINPEHIKKVLNPIKNNFSIGTLATDLQKNEINNPNITKIEIEWNKDIGQAKKFFRKSKGNYKNIYHHVGIYSYLPESLNNFVNLPNSKNEKDLSLEQYRAIDAGIRIGVSYVPEIPISIDTKEDLISAENIIIDQNEKN
ncbi:MAG: hypothetical protein CBD97_00425 [Pelagibacteraceae bacterium TMED237]|nr:MAG: hypothetical protein CBD97_00425 [Pelagibacteraceae bacterium TMED237]|tara:strand:+ start:1410 stop:2141 length:732 start_codon:yes stop_codon:yes gene_type:complete